jgi:hypothetical protein
MFKNHLEGKKSPEGKKTVLMATLTGITTTG